MGYRVRISVVLFVAACVIPAQAYSQMADARLSAPNPLAGFERLVGGQWHLEGSYQEFEWGVGRRSIIARNYFLVEGKPKLVSEGIWYWHPKEKKIKGVFTAIDMPVEVFEYTAHFEGNSLLCELAAYDADGAESAYSEKWEFVGEAQFVWTLFAHTPDGPKVEMSGTYSRTLHPPGKHR